MVGTGHYIGPPVPICGYSHYMGWNWSLYLATSHYMWPQSMSRNWSLYKVTSAICGYCHYMGRNWSLYRATSTICGYSHYGVELVTIWDHQSLHVATVTIWDGTGHYMGPPGTISGHSHYIGWNWSLHRASSHYLWPQSLYGVELVMICDHMEEILFTPGVVGWGKGVMYLELPGRPTDIGSQLGKAYYPCSR